MASATTTLLSTKTAAAIDTGKAVPTHGILRYITRGLVPTASPHLYHLPPLSEFSDVRSVAITDIKPSLKLGDQSPYTIDSHGFTARWHPSKLHSPPFSRISWNDEELLKGIYVPEVENLLKILTGASKVVTEMVLARSSVHSEVDALASSEDRNKTEEAETEQDPWPKLIGTAIGAGASPAPKVHLDYSPTGARTHLRKYHGQLAAAGKEVIAAEDALLESGVTDSELAGSYSGQRWAMFSVWRPLKRIRRDPLAFADRRSFPQSDYIPINIVEPTGKDLRHLYPNEAESHEAETLLAYGSQEHKWCWIWDMEPEEVVVIQLFDSEAERNGYCGVMHSSVEIPGMEDEPARESIEVRCTAFW